MNLDQVKILYLVVTVAGVVLSLVTTYIVWIDKKHVDLKGDSQKREYARLMFAGKRDLLAIQLLLFTVRFRSLLSASPAEPDVRELQWQGGALLVAISLLISYRSARYLRTRKRILSYGK